MKKQIPAALAVLLPLGVLLGDCKSTSSRGLIGIHKSETQTKKDEKKEVQAKAPGVAVNRVRYIVGNIPITDIDIENMRVKLSYLERRRPQDKKKAAAGPDPAQELIKRAIVELIARRDSLLVSRARVENEIQKRKEAMGIHDESEFRRAIKKNTGMPYSMWEKEMPYQLIRRHLLQTQVPRDPPSEEEIHAFYEKNKKKFGMEVAYREMIFRFRNMREERVISSVAREAHKKVLVDPGKFSRVARNTPRNSSPARWRGGYYGYAPLYEIAKRDLFIAGVVSRFPAGRVTPLLRHPQGHSLVVIMVLGRRPTPFDKIRAGIRRFLFIKKEEDSFDRWVNKKKKEFAIIEIK